MIDKWKNFKTAPKNGHPVILWLSIKEMEQEVTATFFYATPAQGATKSFKKAYPEGKGWYSQDTGRKLTKPSIAKGWLPYPQPPTIKQKFTKSKSRSARAAA